MADSDSSQELPNLPTSLTVLMMVAFVYCKMLTATLLPVNVTQSLVTTRINAGRSFTHLLTGEPRETVVSDISSMEPDDE